MKSLYISAVFCLLGLTTNATPTPVAVWSAEGNANDSVGTNHGTLTNGTTFTAGKVGQAFSFDGVNDYIVMPDSATLDRSHVTNALTISTWVKWNGTPTPYFTPIVRKAVASTSIDPWRTYDFGINNNGTIFLSLSDGVAVGQAAAVSSTTAITAGQWHHVAGTYDGANIKLYIDGVLVGTLASNLVIGDRQGSLFIGTEQVGGACFFSGLMDELELSDRALTVSQIQATMQ